MLKLLCIHTFRKVWCYYIMSVAVSIINFEYIEYWKVINWAITIWYTGNNEYCYCFCGSVKKIQDLWFTTSDVCICVQFPSLYSFKIQAKENFLYTTYFREIPFAWTPFLTNHLQKSASYRSMLMFSLCPILMTYKDPLNASLLCKKAPCSLRQA